MIPYRLLSLVPTLPSVLFSLERYNSQPDFQFTILFPC